jgi:tRNA-Thr(GGU) m(6)t(6)A37 methyltransferase TsaA
MEEGSVRFIGLVEEADELAKVRIFPQFCEGIRGLNEYSHIIVLYWFHLRDSEGERQTLKVIPKRHPGAPEVGVFASRSPSRPNPIGLCVTILVKIENCTLTLKGLDALKGSPIVDIKPYLPRADLVPNARVPEWTQQGPPT